MSIQVLVQAPADDCIEILRKVREIVAAHPNSVRKCHCIEDALMNVLFGRCWWHNKDRGCGSPGSEIDHHLEMMQHPAYIALREHLPYANVDLYAFNDQSTPEERLDLIDRTIADLKRV